MGGQVREKRRKVRTRLWLAAGFLAASYAACSGTAGAQTTEFVEAVHAHPTQALREIDDLQTGERWLLLRDGVHPGGPGRLTLATGLPDNGRVDGKGRGAGAKPLAAGSRPRVAIRGGDRLVVEENTAVVAVHLEAVALGPAAPGGSLQARLEIGGKVVRVVALAPGRAELMPQTWGRP